ncbi:transglycosylase family protein [Staphylococcus sp. IVB6181]|uniref:transglycosylase family protein n=1 Tax=Staphylococcus sp. IVB6181 TaxID=2929481 RepID=UPI0021CF4602|nr:transglycosylase family protein [Staphylococcus sp. IVB6181]UXV35797.1 transglycosylase family protein [Staphylococcus sp. IVB6181]
MKKLLVASSATAAFFAVGVGANAQASEQGNADQAQLAETALNNPEQLNESPVQEGAYNISFEYNGLDFNFNSDGTYWTWSYGQAGGNAPAAQTTTQAAPAAQEAPAAEQAAPQAQTATEQAPAQQAAPQQQAPAQQSQEASSGSSVGIPSHLQQIAQRESGGDIHAINPSSGAAGKYQFLQSTWDSVAPAGYVGVSPASAPEHIQDQAAVKLYDGGAGASHWVTA